MPDTGSRDLFRKMTGRDLERIHYLRDAWQRCVESRATIPVRVDEDDALQVLVDGRQRAEQLREASRPLVARINAELDRLKRGRYDRIVAVHLHDVESGVLELARLSVDLQEHLRDAR